MTSYNLQKNRSYTGLKGRNLSPNSYATRGQHHTTNNMSVHSQHLWNMLEQTQLFPDEIHQLLRYEERNLTNYKKMIERQKMKANQQIQHLKIEILHNIDDLKLSISAELDKIYKSYMEKYAILKGQIMGIKKIRDQLQIDTNRRNTSSYINYNANKFESKIDSHNKKYFSKNEGIMKSLEKNNFQIKKYQMLNYIAQLQREKVIPLAELTRQLIILTHYQNGYYQSKQFQNIVSHLIDGFKSNLIDIYQRKKFQFIRQPQIICQKQQEPILNGIYEQQQQSPFYHNNNAIINNMHELKKNQPTLSKLDQPKILATSNEQQNICVEWAENINLNQNHTIKVASNDIILCSLEVTTNIIAVGNKEGNINIYEISSGQQIANLRGHKAGVCKLAMIINNGKRYLASGSDFGCSSIVLWDILTWNMRMKIENHKAAISAIVDLNDNRSLISGSYDKSINIYNLNSEGKMLFNLPINKTAVTSILLNCNNSKMISCGLDDLSINVWQIVRDNGNRYVETMFLQRIIQNSTMICSLVASMLLPDILFLGAKDGKIKLINIDRGEAYKTYPIGNNAIIQLAIVERKSKPQYPLIINWSCLQQTIRIINTESGTLKSINVKGFIQYGCGVGPKAYFLNKGRHLGMLSHSKDRKEITLFKIDIN